MMPLYLIFKFKNYTYNQYFTTNITAKKFFNIKITLTIVIYFAGNA